MSANFTPLAAILGGLILGLAAALLLAANGRIAGITGILGGLFERHAEAGWRACFIVGMLVGGVILLGGTQPQLDTESPMLVIAAGLLVGFGTRMANGCTSGHGICGLGRGSKRSLAATATFMISAIITVAVVRHGIGGLG